MTGTASQPIVMSPRGWIEMHPLLRARANHVHVYDGGRDDL